MSLVEERVGMKLELGTLETELDIRNPNLPEDELVEIVAQKLSPSYWNYRLGGVLNQAAKDKLRRKARDLLSLLREIGLSSTLGS